jgi:hypothetical protein
MTERQIDRIRKSEELVRELVRVAAQIRREAKNLPIIDAQLRTELLEGAEKYEQEAQSLQDALRQWREDIN